MAKNGAANRPSWRRSQWRWDCRLKAARATSCASNAALSAIDQLVKAGSQFIIATYSPILLAYPSAKILLFDQSGISQVAYEDTEHYAVTRDFLNHYERRLQQLLGDGQDTE